MSPEDLLATAEPNAEFVAEWEKIKDSFPDLAKNLPAVRQALVAGKKALASRLPDVSDVVAEEDTTVAARDGYKIPIRIYRPRSPPQSGSPLVLLLHGGGFVLGDIDSETALARLFTKEIGCTCISVDYRLAPENAFPAAPNDCWDVTKWAAANAKSYGANPSQGFIVGGTSAGGNLTDVVGHLARDERLSPPLTGLMELIPVLTNAERMPEKYKHMYLSRKQNADAPILPERVMAGFEAHYKADKYSPLYDTFNHPNGHKGLPPVYFAACGMDPLRDDATVYEHVLREEYGIKTQIKYYSGMPHGFWGFLSQLSTSQQFMKDTVGAMKWLLAQRRKQIAREDEEKGEVLTGNDS